MLGGVMDANKGKKGEKTNSRWGLLWGLSGGVFFLKKYLEKPQREINIATPKGTNDRKKSSHHLSNSSVAQLVRAHDC
jgi:hypothetical protein